MGYLTDCFDILLLKEDAYKKVGNDRNSFKRLVTIYLIITYCILFLIGGLMFLAFSIFAPKLFVIFDYPIVIVISLIGFLLLPFILLFFMIIGTFVQHIIGLLVGGKPNSFVDFFKVYNYPTAILMPASMILGNAVLPIIMVWRYFVLYKSYRVIHRLSSKNAGIAIAINIILVLILVIFFVVAIFYIFKAHPELIIKHASREYNI